MFVAFICFQYVSSLTLQQEAAFVTPETPSLDRQDFGFAASVKRV